MSVEVGTYVSRAGEKLEYALDTFNIDVSGLVCADLGSSTGGFVDCLLQRGARKVYAVDTAYGELYWGLRNNDRVVVLERTNALHMSLPEKVDFVSIDVGWTKQELIVPQACMLLRKGGKIVSLLKPQYEAPKGKEKPFTDKRMESHDVEQILNNVKKSLIGLGITVKATVESPIAGKRKGNKEYLLFLVCSSPNGQEG